MPGLHLSGQAAILMILHFTQELSSWLGARFVAESATYQAGDHLSAACYLLEHLEYRLFFGRNARSPQNQRNDACHVVCPATTTASAPMF